MINEILLTQFNQSEFPLFEQEAFCIPELYYKALPKFNSGKTKKCNILLISRNVAAKPRKISGIVENIQLFNFEKYFSENKTERKKMQLEIVHKGMLEIAAKNAWDNEPFKIAYQECLNSDLLFKKQIRKRKSSPSKKYFLSLMAYCDLNTFKIEWILSNKTGRVIQQNTLLEDVPSSLDIIYLIDLKWISDSQFIVEQNYKGLIVNTWNVFLNI